jgi:hypothetical protein
MGMDNVFPGLSFNPEVHGGKQVEKPKYNISWNQEVIKVQKEFTLEELNKIQKDTDGKPFLGEDATKEEIIEYYKNLLKN